jgi:uncharacterized membrane protein YfhO
MAVALMVILFLLFLIASFGVGFIVNMLAKRFVWTSTVISVVLAGYFALALEDISSKLLLVASVLIGGIAASLTIRTLQRRGFKMFQ